MFEQFQTIFLTSRNFCFEMGKPLFETFRERIVEIGFGNGDFLVHLAEKRGKDTLVLGLEVSAVCVLKAAKRLSSRNLTNSRVIMGDARFILENCVPKDSISTIYMNFPCPWPKNRHSSRRVTYGRFPGILSKVLKTGGEFRLVTDEEWYALEVKSNLSSHPSLDFVSLEIEPDLEMTTKYASKWKAMEKRHTGSSLGKPERPRGGYGENGGTHGHAYKVALDRSPRGQATGGKPRGQKRFRGNFPLVLQVDLLVL